MPPTKNGGASWTATGFEPIADANAKWQCTALNSEKKAVRIPCSTSFVINQELNVQAMRHQESHDRV